MTSLKFVISFRRLHVKLIELVPGPVNDTGLDPPYVRI